MRTGEASVGEHADLVGDVLPGQRAARLLDVLPQRLAHGDDPVRHALHLMDRHASSVVLITEVSG